ncbi:helix-turn-helix domain-containing protein [Cytobacillus gottheilii]|uniref:helix-turn-helix domain-containing protein n=1 Tax=Cytobacillus gottheilii TaxID=859144 RepID=UPI0009BBD6C3|nr:helix-turn-helix domain-containing protein [Cytobacillus gottheilii]
MDRTIGDKIKYIRKELNISQEALAKGICAQSEISRIENNKNYPSYYLLLQLSQRLGVDIKDLIDPEKEDKGYRKDYIYEVKNQLKNARRERDYKLIKQIVESELKVPAFKSGPNNLFLLWHKGMVLFHLDKDPEAAIETLKSCLSCENLNKLYTELDINVLNSLGIINRNLGDLLNAKKYLETAINIIKKIEVYKEKQIINKLFYNLSKVYTDLNDTEMSIKLCKKGISYCNSNEDMYLFADFHYQIGRNYIISNEQEIGIDYWHKAKHILEFQGKNKLAQIIKEEIDQYKNTKLLS